MERSNVKYQVGDDYEVLPSPALRLGIKKVEKFHDTLPRAFLVGRSLKGRAPHLLNTYYDPAFDPLKEVLVDENITWFPDENFSGRVERIEYSPNRVSIETNQNGEGVLVLPENFSFFLERMGVGMDYFVHSFYMGMVPLFVLCSCLLIGREQKVIRFWLVVFGVGVFISMGEFNPLYPLIHEWVPLFNMFKYPQKFFLLCAYALVFLSGWALDRFVEGIINKKEDMKKFLLALLVIAMGVAGVYGSHADRGGLESLMILLLLAIGIFALHLKKINRSGFFSLLLLLMVMDLMGKNAMLVPMIHQDFYTEPPPLAKRLGGTADSFRIYNGMLPIKRERKKESSQAVKSGPQTSSSLQTFNLLDIQLATRDQVYPNLGAIYGLAYVEGSATLMPKNGLLWYESFQMPDIPRKKRVLQRSNVKYWVTEDYEQWPSAQIPRGIKKVIGFEDVLLRAFLVGQSRVVPDAELLDVYYDVAFDPLKEVLLTEPVEIKNEKKFRSGRAGELSSQSGHC